MVKLKKVIQVDTSDGKYRYSVLNTLGFKVSSSDDTDLIDITEADVEGTERALSKSIGLRSNNLAEYIPNYSSIHEVVESISLSLQITAGKLNGLADVVSNEPLDKGQKEDLLDYLEGQYSDGWGESFEQLPYHTSNEEVDIEYLDENDELVYDTEYVDIEYYCSFWQSNGFRIWIK